MDSAEKGWKMAVRCVCLAGLALMGITALMSWKAGWDAVLVEVTALVMLILGSDVKW